MKNVCTKTLVVVLIFASLAATGETPTLKSLYEQHRWFELRGAIKGREAPTLYKGAVASAFNETKDAEKYFNRTIQQAPQSKDAEEAHEMLANLYARSGMSHEAVRQFDAILRMDPGRKDVESIRPIFASFSLHPDQSIGKQRRTIVHAEVTKKGITIPVSIQGKTVHWILDTGFNLSIMSESEARMLGLAVDNISAQAADANGGTTSVHTTVVPTLAIGKVQLHNVPFLVMPDSQEPWKDLSPGRKGIIGLPVAVALQAIRWKSDGTFEIGFAPGHPVNSKKNMCFDNLNPITQVQFEDKKLDFILDTGNGAGTDLWTPFARDFAAMVKKYGKKSAKRVTEVGGSNERPITVLPEIKLRVGGLETKLDPADVFSQPVGDDIHYGLLGMDLLSQAREVRIDFRSMTLKLLP